MLTSVVRHPVSFSILVLSVVILIVWFDYKSTHTSASATAAMEDGSPSQPIVLSPSAGQPKIMNQFGAGANQQQSGAPAIESLLGRLEEKVKADPTNADNRILLAQTYKELGRIPDALKELKTLREQQPENSRIKLVLASILSQSNDPAELEEALQLLGELSDDGSIQSYMVQLYRGDALIRQMDHKGALASWKQALISMPKSDPRYGELEKKVMDLTKRDDASINTAPGS